LSNLDSIRVIKPELKKLLFESIQKPELEYNAARALSSSRIDGYQQALKERLVSGSSTNEIQLFIELLDCDFGNVIDYFFNSLLTNDKYTIDKIFKNNNFIYKLQYSYYYNNRIDSTTREKLIAYSIKLINKFPVDLALYERYYPSNARRHVLDYSFSSGTQLDLVSFLLYSGDKQTLPIIDNLKAIGLPDNLVFRFLYWKFDRDRSKENFKILLKDFEFYDYLIVEIYNQGLLTVQNEDFFVEVLSEMEKPAVSFGLSNEYNRHNLNLKEKLRMFTSLQKEDLVRILNRSLMNESYKETFMKCASKKRSIYRMIKSPYKSPMIINTDSLPDNWLERTSRKPFAFPEIYIKAADSIKKALNAKNYKVFDDFEFQDLEPDEQSDLRGHFKAMQHNSNGELKELNYFCDIKRDVKYSKGAYENGYEDVFEFDCYVFMNNTVYYLKIKSGDDTKKVIYKDLSEKILRKAGSQNRFMPLNFYGDSGPFMFVFGNPEVVKDIFIKYDFKE
jgi:hypothetical protein